MSRPILARLKLWAAELKWLATPPSKRPKLPPGAYESPLDRLSNSVLDAIEAGDCAEGERRCQRLRQEYPEEFWGHTRLAQVREAQGRFEEAAEQYTRALETIRRRPEKADPEAIEIITELRARALAKAKR